MQLSPSTIKEHVADSEIIFRRGVTIHEQGDLLRIPMENPDTHLYRYDGDYGDYEITIDKNSAGNFRFDCSCPYPGDGCKHVVAAFLDICHRCFESPTSEPDEPLEEKYLTYDEIRIQAVKDREKRAKSEGFRLVPGDTYKGEHLVETPTGRSYTVTIHDPVSGKGHCSCPDYAVNRLGTCKHLIFIQAEMKKIPGMTAQATQEIFPFVDIHWDSIAHAPALFSEDGLTELPEVKEALSGLFDASGHFTGTELAELIPGMNRLYGHKRVRFQDEILRRLKRHSVADTASRHDADALPDLSSIKATLYPYQREGIRFALYKPAALIGDEMGLGKTLQAIALATLKKEIFGFKKVLVITLASLKEQWKREIERFTDEPALIVSGPASERQRIYTEDTTFFKITNYEAVLRDTLAIRRMKPDLIILDEAQRIKNFTTKTAEAIKAIPRTHALVLTGTPLENKLEDVYSITQFLDPDLLAPLWDFAGRHFLINRKKKNHIAGYTNLGALHEKLKGIVIRRKKEEVLTELPNEVVSNYYIELTDQQKKIHGGYLSSLLPLLSKKFLTPIDVQRIQQLLLMSRMVCDSTYLIDKKTHISPKLKEFKNIIHDLAVENNRKVVVFSEWTRMNFLIAKHLSEAGIPFVELSGKIPVHKRQALIDEFSTNPDCKVFLSSDAGGTGLNLQAADCVVNFELPWNPAKLNQRIGRVNRIGQTSGSVNVVNLIAKDSIEERILAGIQLKTELFQGVFDGTVDEVEFSSEKRTDLINQLRKLMDEEAITAPAEASDSIEIPDDTPYFLNPEVLAEASDAPKENTPTSEPAESNASTPSEANLGAIFQTQPPEKIEAVLNSGMDFIGGLLEMVTGQKIENTEGADKKIKINKETGEVTMSFKLPGF
ncbi:DEAD/DEAH box helicase [Desulfoluna sp.]|uniref:DEAD/DEAH box helicase n=1 Tax=Desulfoluna sp. TaxID=2045199 RepID=UPI00260670EB|nr:DEAD/DEAH box helicase [Desulfoluna sp.]